jgi:hypothetical protein
MGHKAQEKQLWQFRYTKENPIVLPLTEKVNVLYLIGKKFYLESLIISQVSGTQLGSTIN